MKRRTIVRVAAFPLALLLSSTSHADEKPRSIAVCIGLNSVDPAHYAGWKGTLLACENDAKDMAAIATAEKFKPSMLLTTAAKREAVISAIATAAAELADGDILVVSYSGHGGQIPDLNGDESDEDDETWCLYDGELLDDEISKLWAAFSPGVRIVVFSDSCHSGTVTRSEYAEMMDTVPPVFVDPQAENPSPRRRGRESDNEPATREMPSKEALKTYERNKSFYDELGRSVANEKS